MTVVNSYSRSVIWILFLERNISVEFSKMYFFCVFWYHKQNAILSIVSGLSHNHKFCIVVSGLYLLGFEGLEALEEFRLHSFGRETAK